ncbi:MAG: integrase arm-type DNA-binding domain-containing protein [Desulfobacteraceae bacterium]|nr:integrase arm-type DNA-binding domain-containing protein [Desulfobacteraceae bacterium]
MPTDKLTDPRVRQAKPGKKAYKLFDGGGLYLQVSPQGSKLWRLKYRFGGKEKLLSIGSYDKGISLKRAREERDKARELLAEGIDPAAAKQQAKHAERERVENSFRALALEWAETYGARWTESHRHQVMASLEADAFPSLGELPVKEITPPMVLEVIRAVEGRGALDVASRVLQRTNAVFRYAIHTGRATYNPAADMQGVLKTRKVEHRAAISRAELPELLQRLDAYPGDPITKLALKLIMLTFVRSGELRGARWEEFDLEQQEWRIPAERMKMRAPHIVPLSAQALAVLEELKAFTGRFPLLFPSQRDFGKPVSENTMLYALYRLGYHKRATVHGFRALASTILNETGFRPDVIERQLAHVERNKVRAAYHRSEYLEERRKMMGWWGAFIERQANEEKVVSIRRA